MSKAESLGSEEMVIEDTLVSGCMTYATPVVFIVAAYFVRSSWRALFGAESPIIGDSPFLNFVVGSAILVASLFFCVASVVVLIDGLWKTKMKFYERGVTLHGLGASGPRTELRYGEVEGVSVTEKHNMVAPSPSPHARRRDLLEVALDALSGAKPKERPKVYENSDYTFSFRLRGEAEPAEFRITLHRDAGEADAVVERLAAEGIRAERVEVGEET
jgi:hypothetical protein